MSWTQSLPGARRARGGHREAAPNGPHDSGGFLRLGTDTTERDYANIPPVYLPYHSELTYDQPPFSSQNFPPQQCDRSVEVRQVDPLPSYSHEYFINNQYSQREEENEYSYLDTNNGYSFSDADNGYMTTSFILKDDEVPYHDPTCTVANCQRPSCMVPDLPDDTTIPYHSLTTYDQSDPETECPTRSRSRSRHNKRHRHRSKNEMGSLNAPQPAAHSFRDDQDAPPAPEGVPESLRREKRPLSGSDVLRMSPR